MRTDILKYLLLVMVFAACEEPYEPEIKTGDQEVIVVEGELTDSTVIKLSKSTALEGSGFTPLTGAYIEVLNEDGQVVSNFIESADSEGFYASYLQLLEGSFYKLRIRTENAEVESDLIKVLSTPDIEKLSYRIANGEVEILLDSEIGSAANFYRYNFTETFEYTSRFNSRLLYREGEGVVSRTESEDIYTCYQTIDNGAIILASAAGLSENRVTEKVITQIDPSTSSRLKIEYSIKVSQRVIDEDAYQFWNILKENTESQGTIFDAQPSRLPTNLKVKSGNINVVGYISATQVKSERIFIKRDELPENDFTFYDPYGSCTLLPVPTLDRSFDYIRYGWLIPVTGSGGGYEAAGPYCVDCRERGGSTQKPDFWIN